MRMDIDLGHQMRVLKSGLETKHEASTQAFRAHGSIGEPVTWMRVIGAGVRKKYRA
jgi:hypothetical protein